MGCKFDADKEELIDMQKNLKWMIIPLSQNPCAAAQVALAIEC